MTAREAFDKWYREAFDKWYAGQSPDLKLVSWALFDTGWNARDEEVSNLQDCITAQRQSIDEKNQKIHELLKMLHDFIARVDCTERR